MPPPLHSNTPCILVTVRQEVLVEASLVWSYGNQFCCCYCVFFTNEWMRGIDCLCCGKMCCIVYFGASGWVPLGSIKYFYPIKKSNIAQLATMIWVNGNLLPYIANLHLHNVPIVWWEIVWLHKLVNGHHQQWAGCRGMVVQQQDWQWIVCVLYDDSKHYTHRPTFGLYWRYGNT